MGAHPLCDVARLNLIKSAYDLLFLP